MKKTTSYEVEALYKALYITFCNDSSMTNRLILADAEETLIYIARYSEADIEALQDEALEEQAMEAEVA